MRRLLACVTLILSACGDDEPDRPVDMQFRVGIQELENSCGDDDEPPPEGYTTIVDVFLRSNGNVNVSNYSWFVPGRSVYEDVPVKDGKVNYLFKVETSTQGKFYEHKLEGTATQEHLDLTLSVQAKNWSTDADCVRKVRLTGDARPLLDPTALDGVYAVATDHYGQICAGDPEPARTGGNLGLMEVDQYLPGQAAFYYGQLAWTGQPDAEGALEASFTAFNGFFEIEANVKGVFKPDDVEFSLEIQDGFAADPTCLFRSIVKGAKRLPDAARIDNEYRAAITMTDGCGLGLEGTETSVHLLTQADGEVILYDPYVGGVRATLSAEGAVAYSAGSEEQGAVLTLSGSAAPPHLDYTVEYKQLQPDDTWCTVTYSSAAHVRFVAEE